MTSNTLNRSGRSLTIFAGLVLVTWTTGCHIGPKITEPVRAVWVTRFDYERPEHVVEILDNCKRGGFNTVLFQVRGNGTAFYDSSYEPWADELGGADPGYDPLTLACHEAHKRGLDLHAWVNVMPAWRGPVPPDNPNQLYLKHPDWFWYDQQGKRQGLSTFYVSLNPCLPEVREYLVDVFAEIVDNYDIDGLHMDYIRFPNEPPATPRGSGIDYPRGAKTVNLFYEDTGKLPEDDPQLWKEWRTEQVNKLVGDIYDMKQRINRDVVLTAAIGSVRKNALSHFQDGQAWMDRGIIDAVFLMNYTNDPQVFSDRIDPWLEKKPPVPVIPGLWFGRLNENRTVADSAHDVVKQIEIAVDKTDHFCIFAYSTMFDSADKEELAKQTPRQTEIREVRRKIVLPKIRSLAETQ